MTWLESAKRVPADLLLDNASFDDDMHASANEWVRHARARTLSPRPASLAHAINTHTHTRARLPPPRCTLWPPCIFLPAHHARHVRRSGHEHDRPHAQDPVDSQGQGHRASPRRVRQRGVAEQDGVARAAEAEEESGSTGHRHAGRRQRQAGDESQAGCAHTLLAANVWCVRRPAIDATHVRTHF